MIDSAFVHAMPQYRLAALPFLSRAGNIPSHVAILGNLASERVAGFICHCISSLPLLKGGALADTIHWETDGGSIEVPLPHNAAVFRAPMVGVANMVGIE